MSVVAHVGEFARRQHGLVTRSQLRHAGVTDRRLRTLEQGVLQRRPGGVDVVTGAPSRFRPGHLDVSVPLQRDPERLVQAITLALDRRRGR